MRLLTPVLHSFVWLAIVTGCGGGARREGPASAADFPLPPLSPTVIGALIDQADRLGLDESQLRGLAELDDELRARYAATEDELHELREQGRPQHMAPPGGGRSGGRGGRGGGGGAGMSGGGGGGGMGGGGGGMGGGGPGGGGGMGGGGPGGGGGPPSGGSGLKVPPSAPDPDAQRNARDRIDTLLDERDRDQHASAERALDLMRDDQLEAARAIVDDYFARAAAPPRALPPVGASERAPGAGQR